jgi:hypothetical protein
LFLFSIFILYVNSLFNSIDENLVSDEIGNKIINYVNENKVPLIITDKIIDGEAGSMRSTYNDYLNKTNQSSIAFI